MNDGDGHRDHSSQNPDEGASALATFIDEFIKNNADLSACNEVDIRLEIIRYPCSNLSIF